ncbi:2-methylisocitrate lyase-like PEP mutase family enzyme [Novosphingobium kunmingense]|uniref:2-methylisocitrate lyase-like PEP mutase family enzyme n=1 Tax=Novosphingobium kunmingense TaxID=1211806 RepID=A0A2N0H6S2_9SPHN|nr:isocitrate lyase/PEP mutase family protein [Novosphingobium kunmingense]PKB14590.1 2-methylisocitrate lyase-like PEP mutase family enzyme [Novosphingobium kunmingense]
MTASTLRSRLNSGGIIVAPGIQDMITAVIANEFRFEAVYGTGYWLTASAYGLPDAGIASVTQMVDRMATLVETSTAPVIADADTGYGGLLNVHHTVRAYERAGVSAIQIEDQEFPKKCGHTPGKRVVPTEDMVYRIKVACDARTDADTLVIARSDARQIEGVDEMMRRLEAYAVAGADVLFPEALTSREEMATVCSQFDQPLLANMASGGVTPILAAPELEELGFAIAIYPAMTSLVAAAAVHASLKTLRESGSASAAGQPLYDFRRFCEQIGFEEVWSFDKRWARD